ncbi:MAG TPA: glycerophosphoryl diester phosphodiesterase membrane domain-containing protein [Gaiella sp.]|uniref:glycerophosphoryl diester phosphodiesterase membrane domain-containing protein n=1 Tax=Gaiella sp. TaxID=2663207 RepID=UPI002D7E99F8|nr:glycerophosphoryl diester phosphodiesterase membrane domain-containing protein [Gaiella sp.]HET9287912.1 glycerophosphoryl diester phosphodiesterase membrane domain-containing protein [Gaiella sp.]
MTRARAILILGAVVALLAPPGAALAATIGDEEALARRYAPVVRLVEQTEECGPGERYLPLEVDVLFEQPTVALRGPWSGTDLVKIGPAASDLVGRYEYHLDYPGSALDPGCSYELWARRITGDTAPAVYAHVAGDPGFPGRLALQYWLFYAFNEFNNLHEGDWEMIQLVFEADDAAEALEEPPVEVGYSSHEGAERAGWGDEKLDIVDGTHPVVYPAAGSHANKYTDALYLGSSAEAGVGCDDTRGPHIELRPDVRTIPSDPSAAGEAFPWIGFAGRWGELQRGFFNGPTGPNLKSQWTAPIEWAEDWRDRSYAVPTGGVLGTGATDLFCSGVARGSKALIQLLKSPGPTLVVLALLLGLLAYAIARATWTPVAPLRVARRRAWGQILSSSARMYVSRPRLFLGLGVFFIPVVLTITVLQWLLLQLIDLLGAVTGDLAGLFAYLALVLGGAITLLGFALALAATSRALVEIDAGRAIGPFQAYRLAIGQIRPLVGAVALFVLMWIVLTITLILIPIAIWIAVRWALFVPVIEVERRSAREALRRSADLVRGRWIRVASLVGLGVGIAFAAGPLIGSILIFVSESSLALLNLIAGLVYAFALPFIALVTSYVYFDARTREELEPREVPDELPAEISLDTA